MQQKSESQKYLSNILKQAGHAATKAATDDAEKLIVASINSVDIANQSIPQIVPTTITNSSSFFKDPQIQRIVADNLEDIAVNVDPEIDEFVNETIEILSSTM